MTVTVQTKNVYGNEMIYPIGAMAEHVKRLTGKKTVNLDDIRALQALGIKVVETNRYGVTWPLTGSEIRRPVKGTQ